MRINKTFWMFTIFSIDYYVLTLLHWESKTLSAPNSIKMFISSWIVFFHSHVKEFFYLSIRWGVCVSMQVYVFMQFLPVIFPFIFLLHPFYCSSFLFISRFLSHFLAFSNCCVLDAKPLNVINSILISTVLLFNTRIVIIWWLVLISLCERKIVTMTYTL